MMKDEALVVSSFFSLWGRGWECSQDCSRKTAPLKNFQKNFFGSGCGVVLNGWGELVIRGVERQPQRGGVGEGERSGGDLWSVLFWG